MIIQDEFANLKDVDVDAAKVSVLVGSAANAIVLCKAEDRSRRFVIIEHEHGPGNGKPRREYSKPLNGRPVL